MANVPPTATQPRFAALPICAACGVIAPVQRTSCVLCNAPFPAPPPVAPGALGDAVWACIVEVDVACRSCQMRTPLRGLHTKNDITCERCGQYQAFEPAQWQEGLGHAHNVAATCGPRSNGLGECARIGADATRVELTQNSMMISGGAMTTRTLRVMASPGHPLCAQCKTPLVAELDAAMKLRTKCPRCADAAEYALPADARSIYQPVEAVLSNEERSDRPRALVQQEGGGLVALKCPNCGAALTVSPGEEMVTCGHCKTSSLVPRVATAKKGEPPTFTPFWVLLEGGFEREKAMDEVERAIAQVEPRPAAKKKVNLLVGLITGGTGLIIAIVVLVLTLTHGGSCNGGKAPHHHRHGALVRVEQVQRG